ncbi:MAG: thioesterase family protein [Candidatus Omnitrophica bacterium]|nr:thioesterase family protein [Candidatus Omnitrophota bacterium]
MKEFCIEKKVYYHDTDAGGIVYYANYLKYLEEGRSEYCLKQGVDLVEYMRQGIVFPVVRLEIDYKNSARYGDTIQVKSRIEKLGNASVYFVQEIRRGEALLAVAKTVWACVSMSIVSASPSLMRPQKIPDAIRQKLLTE